MDRGKLIGGTICLAIAALLAVLNLTLPPEDISFMVEGRNMPWVPPIILGIIGIALLATSGKKKEEPAADEVVPDEEKIALNKRLEAVGWGLFLIMLGGFILVPNKVMMKGWWSVGIGVIMLGLNATRYFYNIKMSGFTTFLGVVSLVSGILQLLGKKMLEGGILIIVLGAYLIIKPWVDRRQLFGKAEES